MTLLYSIADIEKHTQDESAYSLAPPMPKITNVIPLDDYNLELTFDDGVTGGVDLSRHAGKGVFAAWNDPDFFRSVRIGPNGGLVWGDDIDLCPDALYLEATGKRPEDLFPALKRENARA